MNRKKKKTRIHVKEGDQVRIISGNHKGKIGEIKKIIKKTHKVIINNINLKIKHIRPKQENEAGQVIEIECPIHSSNVMLYSSKEKVASKYKTIIKDKGIKQRVLKKTQEVL